MSEPATVMHKDFSQHVLRFASMVASFSEAVLSPGADNARSDSKLAALSSGAWDLGKSSPAIQRHYLDIFEMRRLTCFKGNDPYYEAEALLSADSIIMEVSRLPWDKSTAHEAKKTLLAAARNAYSVAKEEMKRDGERCSLFTVRFAFGHCLILLSMARRIEPNPQEIRSWCYDMLELWLGEALVHIKSRRMGSSRKMQLVGRALWKSAQVMDSHHLDD